MQPENKQMPTKNTTFNIFSQKYIKGDYYCNNNNIQSLKGVTRDIPGIFDCSNNQLISLEFGLVSVENAFKCSFNKLKSLQGLPRSLGDCIIVSTNDIQQIKREDFPDGFKADIWIHNNPALGLNNTRIFNLDSFTSLFEKDTLSGSIKGEGHKKIMKL